MLYSVGLDLLEASLLVILLSLRDLKKFIYLITEIHEKKLSFRTKLVKKYSEIEIIYGDVRNPIDWIPDEKISLIANFAAIHREPGHEIYEYFDCNLKGAYNVCNFADKVGYKKMIFQVLFHHMVLLKN